MKKKLTLVDLQPKPYKVELVHPHKPELKFWVLLESREVSLAYSLKAFELASKSKQLDGDTLTAESLTQQNEWVAELAAVCILDWDADNIGMPYSQENVIQLLSKPYNAWIRTKLEEVLSEQSNFFINA